MIKGGCRNTMITPLCRSAHTHLRPEIIDAGAGTHPQDVVGVEKVTALQQTSTA